MSTLAGQSHGKNDEELARNAFDMSCEKLDPGCTVLHVTCYML